MERREHLIPNPILFDEIQYQIQQGKQVKLRIRGSSMLPFARHNDNVMLEPATAKDIRIGSVVLAHTNESGIVLHRIYRIQGDHITLLGDGNTNQFEHTSPARIIAIVSTYYRGELILYPNKFFMRQVGILWMWIHPWRKSLINVLWKIKKSITQ